MGTNLHGSTDKIFVPWSSWTGYYAQLIGRNCFQIVCCKVHPPTTVQLFLDYRTARRARSGFILKFSGLNCKAFRLRSRMHATCVFLPLRDSPKNSELSPKPAKWKVGHVNSHLSLAREILHMLEIAQDNRDLTDQEIWLRNRLKKHSLALSYLQHYCKESVLNWMVG